MEGYETQSFTKNQLVSPLFSFSSTDVSLGNLDLVPIIESHFEEKDLGYISIIVCFVCLCGALSVTLRAHYYIIRRGQRQRSPFLP